MMSLEKMKWNVGLNGENMGRAITRDIDNLNPGTFGGSKACHVLIEMMNQNVITTFHKHKVLNLITSANITFKNLRYIPDVGVREQVMTVVRDNYYRRIKQMPYPARFCSFLENVIFYIFKKNLEKGLNVVEVQL